MWSFVQANLSRYSDAVSVYDEWRAASLDEKANFFEFVIEEVIKSTCGPRDIAVDAGANYGAHTSTMLSAGAHTHAFEPNPELAHTLESWGHERLTVHRVALSDHQGTARFHFAESAGCGSLRIRPHLGITLRGDSCEVAVSRLDDFAFSPKLIKADVEGEEINFLRGAWTTLTRARPLVLLELDRRAVGETAIDALLEELPDIGYGAFNFLGKPFGIDDWDAWNVLLYPERTLPAAVQATLDEAGLKFFRDLRSWNPYQKLAR